MLAEADAVVKEALGRIFDDPELENANWHSADGRTFVSVATTSDLGETASPTFEADYPADSRNRSSAHGVYFTGLKLVDPAKRTIQLDVKNFWLRFVAVYVDFFAPNGFGVASDEPPLFDGLFDGDIFNVRTEAGKLVLSRFVTVVGANNDFLGIPVLPADAAPTPLKFNMPPQASTARVRFLTLGLGGPGYSQPGRDPLGFAVPIGLTGLFNIGVPAYLIAATIGTDPAVVASFTSIAKSPKLWLDLSTVIPLSIFNSVRRDDARPFLLTFGSKLVALTLKALPAFAQKLIALIGLAQAQQAVPVVGWGVKMASLSAATAKLGQTVGEVLSSPPLFENKISVTLTTKLTITHDPRDTAGFPATATRWEVHATYNGQVGEKLSGTLPTTLTDPIYLEFRVPSGGTGKIDVWFLTDTNWIAGYGTTGEFANLAADLVLIKAIEITENLVPLTAKTRYQHRQKLAISGGQYVWQTARDAPPTQTAAALVCDDSSLCGLNGITLSQNAAIAGYSWQARSRTVPVCGSGSTSSPVQRIQNVSFAQRPNDGLKKALCAYSARPLLAYQLQTLSGETGRYFYLDPRRVAGGFHLRAVSLDTTPFDQTAQLSWGQFSQLQNGVAIHPAGYVVGVNVQFHKLEILRLPASATAEADAVASVLKAGHGTRIGLLDTPTAVGVDLLSGAILVLDAGNGRIQAFDVFGNPTPRFNGGTSEVRPLYPENNATYLDMAVESTGWIYVLSFAGSGRNPADYRLDIYDPDGTEDTYLSRTTGVAAAKMAVDLWRNIFTLNYEPILTPDGVEPSLSQWIPSTPDGCSQDNNPFCQRL